MAEKVDATGRNHLTLRDVPGATIALAALAVLGAAAIVSAPLAVWYWRKRKRADVLASYDPDADADPRADAIPPEASNHADG